MRNAFLQINTVYNVYMYMVLMTFLPFFLLSILNALIVKKVQTESISAMMPERVLREVRDNRVNSLKHVHF